MVVLTRGAHADRSIEVTKPPLPVFIVCYGNAANGKDTFADMLARHLAPTLWWTNETGAILRASFADPLKEAALHLVGVPKEVSYGPASVKEGTSFYGKTARHWLQWLGTEIGREQIHRDVWVHRAADRGLAAGARYVILSDGRFENERTGLREYLAGRGIVINVLVHRPEVPIPTGPGVHPSEAEVADMRRRTLMDGNARLFDFVVANDGPLARMDARAQTMAQRIAGDLDPSS